VNKTRLRELYTTWRAKWAAIATEHENAGRDAMAQRIRDEIKGGSAFLSAAIKDMDVNPHCISERREQRNANNRASYYRRTLET